MKAALFTTLLLLSALLGCRMEPEGNSTPNNVRWTGAWENDAQFYGTFTIVMTLKGTFMDQVIGRGTIAGNVTWKGLDGTPLVDTSVTGTWENDLSTSGPVPHDAFDFTLCRVMR